MTLPPLPESFTILSRLKSGTEEVMLLASAIEYAAACAAAERERCAQVCDEHASCEGIAQKCAAAIRAQKEIR